MSPSCHLRSIHLAHGGAAAKGKDAPKKAVLISGPPGIGKTSAAKIVCRTLGFDVLEVNASDSRGKVGPHCGARRTRQHAADCPPCSPAGELSARAPLDSPG